MTRKSPGTRDGWLESFARRLAWHFPEVQAKDIFADYQEQFDAGAERGKSDPEIIEALGTPAEAVTQLLEEDPSARSGLLRHCLLWGAALMVCLAFIWLSFLRSISSWAGPGICVFLPVFAAVLFMLVRGPGRVAMEKVSAAETRTPFVSVFVVPMGAMLACLAAEEILALFVFRFGYLLPVGAEIGPINTFALSLFALVMALLALWMLFRCVTRSIRYFPGIVHALGVAFSALFMMGVYTSMDVNIEDLERTVALKLLVRMLPYLAGLVTARFFQHWVDGSKPLPYCFREKNVTWPSWQHSLAVSLSGWFPAGQTIEILEDYQEQFEMGREAGKPETDLLAEMGRPSTIVRDLLAEDRKARRQRKKRWGWIALCVISGWTIVMLMRTFESGYWGIGQIFIGRPVQMGVLAVVMGTVSLFVLLRVRDRAVVERRFPAQKTPAAGVFLLPFVFAMVMNGFLIYLCASPWSFYRAVRLYLVVWIESSVLALFLLMIWTLARCFSGSIRYLPAAIHAAGCACFILCTGLFCSGIDFEGRFGDLLYIWFLPCLLPYAVGVVLAAGVWLVIRMGGLPRKEG